MHLRPTVQQDLKIDFAQHSCHAFAQLQHDSSFLFTDKSSELRAGSGKKEVRTGMKPCLSYSAYLLLSLSISLASLYVPSLSREPQVSPTDTDGAWPTKVFGCIMNPGSTGMAYRPIPPGHFQHCNSS